MGSLVTSWPGLGLEGTTAQREEVALSMASALRASQTRQATVDRNSFWPPALSACTLDLRYR